jgi:hypothetical protein
VRYPSSRRGPWTLTSRTQHLIHSGWRMDAGRKGRIIEAPSGDDSKAEVDLITSMLLLPEFLRNSRTIRIYRATASSPSP